MILVVAATLPPRFASNAFAGDEQWDGQFFNPGIPSSSILALATTTNGNVICGGTFPLFAGVSGTGRLARWDGSKWSSIGGGVTSSGTIYSLAVNGSDIIVGGSFTSIGGVSITNLARWDGTNWNSIGDGVSGGSVRAIAFFDGYLFVGGTFNRAGTNVVSRIARWDGSGWDSVGGGVNSATVSENSPPVSALLTHGGALYAGGRFHSAGGIDATNIARWNGSTWASLGSGPENGVNGNVFALASDDFGNLIMGGNFSRAGTNFANMVAAWDGANWSSLAEGVYQPSQGRVATLSVINSNLYVGGTFTTAGAVSASGFARWDGTNWHSVPAPVRASVLAIGSESTNIYVSGSLIGMMTGQVNGIIKFDGNDWSTLGAGINSPSASLRAICISDKVIVGGSFGGQYVAQWDGVNWIPFTGTLAGSINSAVNALSATPARVYAAGLFSTANGITANGISGFAGSNWFPLGPGLPASGLAVGVRGTEVFVGHNQGIARWDGTNWSQLGEGLAGAVRAIAFVGRDLYAGGSFTNSGNASLSYVARWNGTNWSSLDQGFDGPVQALSVWNQSLYAGGNFNHSGALPLQRIARWDGMNWSNLGVGMTGSVAVVYALASSADGALYAAGSFQSAGDQPALNIAKWDGSHWSALGSGVNSQVRALAIKDADLFVGGDFSTAGGKSSSRFARWQISETFISPSASAPDSAESGASVSYTLRIRNLGSAVATNCVAKAKLPIETSFLSASNGGVLLNGEVVWYINVGPTNETDLTFAVRVNAAVGQLVLDDYSVSDSGRVFRGPAAFTTITGGNPPPLVSVVEPSQASSYPTLANVPITVSATDTDGIRQVDFYNGPNLLGSRLASPYSLVMSNARAGSYNLTVVATDSPGATTSTNVTFQVDRPVNDNFSDRISLPGIFASDVGLIIDATTESGEPNHDGFWKVNSIWWTWHAPDNGRVTINTAGSDCAHVLVVYTGNSVSNLTGVIWDKLSVGPTTSQVVFNAIADTDYQIVVDGGYPFTAGRIALHLGFNYAPVGPISSPVGGLSYPGPVQIPVTVNATDTDGSIARVELFLDVFSLGTHFGPPPFTFLTPKIAGGDFSLKAVTTDNSGQQVTSAMVNVSVGLTNDLFANRVLLEGYQFTSFGTTVGAGSEAGEPVDTSPSGARHSVWWRWTAPISASVTVMADSQEYSAGVQAYTGPSISSLVRVAGDINDFGHNEFTFNAVAGTEYKISVDGFHFAAGTASGKYRLTGRVNGLENLALRTVGPPGPDGFQLQAQGLTGMSIALQRSTNLINWTTLSTNSFAAPIIHLADTNAQSGPLNFYRILLLP